MSTSRFRVFTKKFVIGSGVVATSCLTYYFYFKPRKLTLTTEELKAALEWTPPSRKELITRLKSSTPSNPFDLLIIGGGATGTGCALDAASRSLSTALIERRDFAAGTSSRSTKLVHGGVRYLEKAIKEADKEQWNLVREALLERKRMLQIMPHLTHSLPIMLPIYSWFQIPYYWAGSKAYDMLAGASGLQTSKYLNKSAAIEAFPMLREEQLVGAMVYYDGQMNDARCNLTLALTAIQKGATVTNYTEAISLIKDEKGRLQGAIVRDVLSGEEFPVYTRGVINATGPYCDGLRKMDDPSAIPLVVPSAGAHIVLPDHYSPASMGLIDPQTKDGRIIFLLPWEGNTIAGTTDAPTTLTFEPKATCQEVEFILNEVESYLGKQIKVRKEDILSAWSGIRPLIRDPTKIGTGALVRNHLIEISKSGLLTIAGGKWTTYRMMAQETIDKAIATFSLDPKQSCQTHKTMLIGGHAWESTGYIRLIQLFGLETDVAKHLLHYYGDRAAEVAAMAEPSLVPGRWPLHGHRLLPHYPIIEAEIRWACRREYAVNAVDVLARRLNLSFLNAQAARDAVPRIIAIMSEELGWSSDEAQRQRFACEQHLLHQGAGVLGASRAIFDTRTIADYKQQFYNKANVNGRISISDATELLRHKALTQECLKNLDKHHIGTVNFADFLEFVASLDKVNRGYSNE